MTAVTLRRNTWIDVEARRWLRHSVDSNGTTLRVSPARDFRPQPFTVLGWEVPDIKATVKALTAAGIEFVRVQGLPQDELGIWSPSPGIFVAWFKDPDGNMLSVAQH